MTPTKRQPWRKYLKPREANFLRQIDALWKQISALSGQRTKIINRANMRMRYAERKRK